MSIKFKVRSLLWLDDWVDVGFFRDRKSAIAFRDATKLSWPLHSFRVVSYKRSERALKNIPMARPEHRQAGISGSSRAAAHPRNKILTGAAIHVPVQ
ncbi:hypothetical protein [Bradyrhizobium sp. Arg816]|uniref:hypothetical protein n=1 Tax=Bradyrhizobium sp. Arg816 TaxID=2998491 RepID=UPI00249F36EA|nr:hypothetical protein [Bradyrhizobium sp. Arg816]MDI3567428.1 hypothetical protein [Bradyrhizobium sp. Arg816]